MIEKKTIKKAIVGILLLSAVSSCMTGCAQFKKAEEVKEINIAVITKNGGSDYWDPVELACNDIQEEYNGQIHVEWLEPNEESVEAQTPLIEQAISDKVDAIVLAAVDPNAENDTLAKASNQGIPILTIDSDVTYGGKSCYIGTQNAYAGKAAVRQVASLLNNKGDIGIIYHGDASTATERRDGFIEAMSATKLTQGLAEGAGSKGNNSNPEELPEEEETAPEVQPVPNEEPVYKDMKIVSVEDGESDWDKSKELARKMILDNHVSAIFATNRKGAWGACSAIEDLIAEGKIKENEVRVVGFDYFEHNGKDAAYFLNNNILYCTAVQNPYNMGYLGVKRAKELAEGSSAIVNTIDTGFIFVSSDNINTEDVQFLINPTK